MAAAPSPEQVKLAATISCLARGCMCNPDVGLMEVAPDVYSLQIAHDEWCPVG